MTTALEKVRVGEPFNPTAATWNEFVHAAQAQRDREIGGGANVGDDPTRETVIVKNSSGSDLARYSVLAVSDILIDPDDNESEFIRTMALDCDLAKNVAGANANLIVILQEPIEANGVGQAIIDGITPCKINVNNTSHKYAMPGTTAGYLESASTGFAKILWKAAGTGEQWALVRIPAEDGQSIRLLNASGDTLSDGYVCGIDGVEPSGPQFAFRAIAPVRDNQEHILPMVGPDLANAAARWIPLGPVMRFRLAGRVACAAGESVGTTAGSHLMTLGNLGFVILGEEVVSKYERYVYVVHGEGATPTGTFGTETDTETDTDTETETATDTETETATNTADPCVIYDDFNRTEDPLSDNGAWTMERVIGTDDIQTDGDYAILTEDDAVVNAFRSWPSVCSDDMCVEASVDPDGADGLCMVYARASSASRDDSYSIIQSAPGSSNPTFRLISRVGGAATLLDSADDLTSSYSTVIRLECDGTTITGIRSETEELSAINSDHSSGNYVGFGMREREQPRVQYFKAEEI